ncbi:transcriptional regulator family: Fungal Specific TF [Paecilomyces variotii]|nr:transcriptional regulator family: Fungal Specific TF [Paecilomyces variotii]KAJ9206883.1 transcriptional regulator family: Fungal Specific TF [Paecilomyces variotii]KAJ9217711.1 transcriptional regulator family: Fungal Specific TF [Paecilomyces variotii]KAJ9227861.1 transcriptional regulator family: Fungal Specific TF [Paecilomyces variotii]KAJ9255335.1 transcriptional regulator family: Fungal Specific TF [Paecilomyces variotii]
MATVITIQPTSAGPAAGPVDTSPTSLQQSRDLFRHRAQQMSSASSSASDSASTITALTSLSSISRGPSRDGASCDACLRRKSRCAMNEMVNKCYSCEFHRQDCTFTLSSSITSSTAAGEAQSRKRKLDETTAIDQESTKRSSKDRPTSSAEMPRPHSSAASLASPRPSYQSNQHIGMTTELEPALLEHLPLDQNDETLLATSRVRKFAEDGVFMRLLDVPPSAVSLSVSVDTVENMVAPYGPTLVEKYFQRVHPTFPILIEDAFRQAYRSRRGLSPLLLAAVYVIALKFVDLGSGSQPARRPDANRLESTAMKLLNEALPRANIAAMQAGLLLMQRSNLNTSSLNAQLVNAAFELGLHQDCSNWKMEEREKGLRKRLAWALYLQDKWSSLVHGRPSHIFSANWTVKDLTEQDFLDAFPAVKREDGSAVGHGPLLFCQFVVLTSILSDILDSFYTLRATEIFNASGINQTRIILERAKPVQIRLKEWFSRLPSPLKMDSSLGLTDTISEEAACNGALHLAYFATEITLHRCIVRSLKPETADPYLSHICRSAAKTRLISAMDFVNRLRPAHFKSFWPAASRTNFALIGSFGVLLEVTAPTKEEAEFYSTRLAEYRWTLSVSSKNAGFLHFAVESLDVARGLVKNVPEKPGIEELMANSAKTAIQHRNSQRDGTMSDAQAVLDGDRGGSASVVSGLASPATSVSDEDDMQDSYV